MPDRLFAVPELARLYDPLDPDRRDLEHYVRILAELGATSVLDVGCGTGTFALMLAGRGLSVTGLDPAEASLEVARGKAGAEHVRWIARWADEQPRSRFDAVTMTGNVAQVFVTDEEWVSVLQASRRALRPGGHLIFETRDPAAKAWRGWTRDQTQRTVHTDVGPVTCFEDVTAIDWPTVTFRTTFLFPGRPSVTSTSKLRFRDRREIDEQLASVGFDPVEVRDAPDRPGLEFVFIATRPAAA